MLGPEAGFREGQWEAIDALANWRARVLVVQKTGWGKSLVYFIATRLLRDAGAGPTLLISPLLSLMRNQIEMAERIGVRALTINSANKDEWRRVEQALTADACDVLLISPERLANTEFQESTLPAIQRGIGLFVVDEAHCISDWGHDFRPDYRRVVRIVRSLPPTVPILATTATANDRVVADITEQLGEALQVQRGSLARPSLRLQVLALPDQASRLAWLLANVHHLPGSGIIYCLTVADCERVADFLQTNGISAPAYHGQLENDPRADLEQQLLRNEVKALVATVALGMGFDKPDLGFVIHYQRPGSVVAYYQQIGRAGRALDDALVILMTGQEDDEISEYFIRSAFPGVDAMLTVLDLVEAHGPLSVRAIQPYLNLAQGRIAQCLTLLEIDGAVARDGGRYWRTPNAWASDVARWQRVTDLRRHELARMQAFTQTDSCLMEFVARELDDPTAAPCGHCAICAGLLLDDGVEPALVQRAIAFLRRDARPLEPRKQWPAGPDTPAKRIAPVLQNTEGRALCLYGDAGWGQVVAQGKYQDRRFSDALVQAAAELVRERWRTEPPPAWVTAVPSLRHPELVPAFARRLAATLGLPFHPALVKVRETAEQKEMANSAQQYANILGAFQAVAVQVQPGPVLLVDDMVDSGWTLTLCGVSLREAGCGIVHPLALASTAGTRKTP